MENLNVDIVLFWRGEEMVFSPIPRISCKRYFSSKKIYLQYVYEFNCWFAEFYISNLEMLTKGNSTAQEALIELQLQLDEIKNKLV